MQQYKFVTTWTVEAAREAVWEWIVHSECWPVRWHGVVRVDETEAGDESGVGSLRRYTFSSWLPYNLSFDMRTVSMQPQTFLEGHATGDLVGTGRWYLQTAGEFTV